jgi:hypothetical protein
LRQLADLTSSNSEKISAKLNAMDSLKLALLVNRSSGVRIARIFFLLLRFRTLVNAPPL